MLSRVLRAGGVVLAGALLLPFSLSVFGAEGRQIEEVVVTAERRESTVQDTAISITAFTGEFIEDFGLRNQEDLQNYIPATTIQPYDLSVRGVGRLYRALGGDPGVATYFDGAYSEDFGIASTEGGLFDLERIEVLRGPQGTLYGRNGLGGAVNFHSKRPTDEFQGEIKAIVGSYETKEVFGVLSGPIIPGFMNARATAVKRTRDGFVEENGIGPDLNSYGDENYALTLEFTPSDNFNILVRGNERSYRREMSGAQGAGAIIVSEMGGIPDPVTGGKRWSSVPVFGWRPVQDPNAPGATFCASATDRTTPDCIVPTGLVPYINGTAQGSVAGTGVYRFNHNGMERFGQPAVAGVDATTVDATHWQNWSYQANGNAGLVDVLNRTTIGDGTSLPDDLDGEDLQTYTNGFNDEFFDHQAAYASVTWDINERFTLKYIGAYTDYFYDRTTEHDRTGLPRDNQFYAAQENENFQHELQFFYDFTDNWTLTAGLFTYANDIDQQLDFYSPNGWSKFDASDNECGGCYYGGFAPSVWGLGDGPMIDHRSAQDAAFATPGADGGVQTRFGFAQSAWLGDNFGTTGKVDHGPVSAGTTFIWDTENRTDARAIYLQTEWQINDTWALTVGARWAEDDKEGEENLFLYRESMAFAAACVTAREDAGGTSADCGDGNGDGVVTLAEYNQNVTGALDADGNVINFDTLRKNGIPFALGLYREFERDFDDLTWRVNVDFTPTEDDLVYLSATSGYRAGGFNLGFFSPTTNYDKETITAFELGYKGQLLDGTLQVNASAYYYDYEDISLQFLESGMIGEGTSVSNAPGARTIGGEVDVLWLATDNLTIGFNFSYTDAKYEGELDVDKQVVDTSNPLAPIELYTSEERKVPIDGEPLPRIPQIKWTGWAEYTMSLGDNGKVIFLTTVNYTDEFAAAGRPLPDSPLVTAPEYMRWDARVSWLNANEQWNVTGFVNNITDEIGTRNMFTYSSQGGYRRAIEPTNPRMAGLEIQYKFGAFQ